MKVKLSRVLIFIILAVSLQIRAQSVDVQIGLSRSREFSEVFSSYASGASIKVSADGSLTTTVSSNLAAALSTKGVDGPPNNSSQTEVGVIGFQANGSSYFAIIQIDGHIDGVGSTIGLGSGKLGVSGTTINALGESLNLQVTDILDAQGVSITDPSYNLVIDDIARFIFYTTGNATSNEKLEVYVNSKTGVVGGTPPQTTGYDYLVSSTSFPTSPDPVTEYRVRRPANDGSDITVEVNVTFRYTTLQFVTSGFPVTDIEINGYDSIADVDAGYEVSPTYADAAAVISYLNANITAATISGTSDTVAITGWAETDTYNPAAAGSYTFTGTLDTANLPPGYVDNIDPISSVDVEVVIQAGAPDVDITSADLADGKITVSWNALTGVDHYVVQITKGDLTTFDLPETSGTSQVINFSDFDFGSAVDPDLSNKGFDPVFLPIVVRSEDVSDTELSNSSADTSFTVNGQNRTCALNAVYLGKTAAIDYVMIGDNTYGTAFRNCAVRLTAQNVDGNKVTDYWIKRVKNESPYTNVIYQLPDTDPDYDPDFNVVNQVHPAYRDLTWKNSGNPVIQLYNGETITLNLLVRDNKTNSTGTQQNSCIGILWIDWNGDGDFDDTDERIDSDYQIGFDLNNDGTLSDTNAPVTATAVPNWLELYRDSDNLGPMPNGSINASTTGYYAQSTISNLIETSAVKTPSSGLTDMNGWDYSFVYDGYNDVIRLLVDSSDNIVSSGFNGQPLWIKRSITAPSGVSAGKIRARMRYGFGGGPANSASYDRLSSSNSPVYDFEIEVTDTPTPAREVTLLQTGKEVRWTVGQELDVKEYRLVDSQGKVIQVVQPNGAKEYVVNLDELITVELQIVGNDGHVDYYSPEDGNSITARYDLKRGWNLISTVGTDSNIYEALNLQGAVIWAWNGTNYELTDGSQSHQGLWVYSPDERSVLTFAVKSDGVKKLQAGWNLVGPSNTISAPTNVNLIYTWDPQGSKYLENYNTINKGTGYWIFTEKPVEIQLDTVK